MITAHGFRSRFDLAGRTMLRTPHLAPGQPMPKLYACFSMGTDWTSKLIGRFTKSNVSHAFLAWFSEEFDAPLALGAMGNGLTIETLDTFIKQGHTIPYIFSAPKLWVGTQKNADLLDTPYDWGGLLGMSFVSTWYNLTKHLVGNPLSWKGALFCSCYLTMVCRDSGYPVLTRAAPTSISPGLLKGDLLARVGSDGWTQATIADLRKS